MVVVEKLQVSWATIGRQFEKIGKLLEEQQFDRVIGISRGGLPLGVALSHRFNLPFTVVGVSSYNDETHEQETLVCDTPDVIFEGWEGSIVVCDDIADSGKTLDFLLQKIRRNPRISNCTTVTIYYKDHSIIEPDVYLESTDKWVVFPWEREG